MTKGSPLEHQLGLEINSCHGKSPFSEGRSNCHVRFLNARQPVASGISLAIWATKPTLPLKTTRKIHHPSRNFHITWSSWINIKLTMIPWSRWYRWFPSRIAWASSVMQQQVIMVTTDLERLRWFFRSKKPVVLFAPKMGGARYGHTWFCTLEDTRTNLCKNKKKRNEDRIVLWSLATVSLGYC